MRPLITLLIAVFLLSGIYVYTQFADSVRPKRVEYVADYSASQFVVRLNRTFDCEGNSEFGLGDSLVILFKGEKALHRSDRVSVDELVEVELPGVELGQNAIFVEAQIASEDGAATDFSFEPIDTKKHAMQIEVLRDGIVVESSTFWIEPGLNSVSGSIHFQVKDEPAPTHDNH